MTKDLIMPLFNNGRRINKTTNVDILNKSGSLHHNSTSFNDTCLLINGYNLENLKFDDTSIFGISGIISFNDAISRVNNKNLTNSQLFSLYVNRDIRKLSDISFGKRYSELDTAPSGRESLNCNIRDISNISDVININNFQWFTNIYFIANEYPNLLEVYGDINSKLTKSNQKILNLFLYNNLFPERSNRKKYAYLANKKLKHTSRIFPDEFKTSQNVCELLNKLRNK